jgi:hypothetical protein
MMALAEMYIIRDVAMSFLEAKSGTSMAFRLQAPILILMMVTILANWSLE